MFLKAAVALKRRYFDLTSDLAKYESRLQMTQSKLQEAIDEVDQIDRAIKDRTNSNIDSKTVADNLVKILSKIEEEGLSIEKYINPINKEIEKLAVEEEELYRRICERHNNLSEAQIVESVRQRLKKENLL